MVIIFLIIGPSIIMYSQGYRFDIKKFQFVETGGLYIKAFPEEVQLYINDKYINKTSFFTRDILVQNLLPDNYNIRVEKDGYHSWKKNLEIDVKKDSPKLISRDKVDAFTIDNNSIIALRGNEVIKLYDLVRAEEPLYSFEYYNKNSDYQIVFIEKELFIIEDNKNLYFLNKENNSFENKINAQSELRYTPFFNKILFYDDNNIWLMPLKRYESPFFKDAYSIINIASFDEKIDIIRWLNGDYFVFTLDKKIYISEIDNRDNLNMFDLGKNNVSNLFFNGNTKKLYILNDDELLETEKLIP
ncbi:MAG: transmembrane(s)proteins 9..31 [Parcubacteria bacterium 34_609]|nr:MAG: transmembrane(s)proteins 9..31 [Parcubacteria bacterium 34_609]